MYLELWVKLRCSPRCTQMVSKWHLAAQLAGTDFFITRARRAPQKTLVRAPPAQ